MLIFKYVAIYICICITENTACIKHSLSLLQSSIVASCLVILKNVGFSKVNTETCPKKENKSVQYSTQVVWPSEWTHSRLGLNVQQHPVLMSHSVIILYTVLTTTVNWLLLQVTSIATSIRSRL